MDALGLKPESVTAEKDGVDLSELEQSISELLGSSARAGNSDFNPTNKPVALKVIDEKGPDPVSNSKRSVGSDGEKKQGRIKTFNVADVVMIGQKLEFSQHELINLMMQIEDLANIANTAEALAVTGQLSAIFLIANVLEKSVRDKWIVQAFRMAFIHCDLQQAIRLLSEYSLTIYLNQRDVVSAAI